MLCNLIISVMRLSRSFDLLAIGLLILGAIWIFASRVSPSDLQQSQAAPQTGFLAPDFTLTTLDGESITLSDLRGHPVLVNWWASWCLPCRAEMPAMQRVYERYQDAGFIVLAVNATTQDSRGAAQAFVDEYGFTYPILLDLDGGVAFTYRLRAFPSSYFINADGVISEVVLGGPMDEALLVTRVEQLLGSE
jgi:cytochrome c biogenesis protein CcmG/thiol:disulfide interchange protein DsbE